MRLKRRSIWFLLIAAFLAYPFVNWFLHDAPMPAESERSDQQALQAKALNEAAAQTFIKSRLKDPGSVKFGAVYSRGESHVCGFFNAKNSLGGYVGEKGFIADMQTKQVHIQGESTDFELEWARTCADK